MSEEQIPKTVLKNLAKRLGTTLEEHPTLQSLSEKLKKDTEGAIQMEYLGDEEINLFGFTEDLRKVELQIDFDFLDDDDEWQDTLDDVFDEIDFQNLPPEEREANSIEKILSELPTEDDYMSEKEIAELRKEDKNFAEIDAGLVKLIKKFDQANELLEKAEQEDTAE